MLEASDLERNALTSADAPGAVEFGLAGVDADLM